VSTSHPKPHPRQHSKQTERPQIIQTVEEKYQFGSMCSMHDTLKELKDDEEE